MLLLMLLGILCAVIAVGILPVGLLLGTPGTRPKWFMLSGIYLGAGLLLLLVRGVVGLFDRVAKGGSAAPAAGQAEPRGERSGGGHGAGLGHTAS